MPTMPRPKCKHTTCLARAESKSSYCKEHLQAYYSQEKKVFGNDPFYNSKKWRNFRATYLATNPFCAGCMSRGYTVRATVLDHITPRSQGGKDFDVGNLQPLCTPCHNRKRQSERKKISAPQGR
jgi:5-methylcytosine-specific restriction protein A